MPPARGGASAPADSGRHNRQRPAAGARRGSRDAAPTKQSRPRPDRDAAGDPKRTHADDWYPEGRRQSWGRDWREWDHGYDYWDHRKYGDWRGGEWPRPERDRRCSPPRRPREREADAPDRRPERRRPVHRTLSVLVERVGPPRGTLSAQDLERAFAWCGEVTWLPQKLRSPFDFAFVRFAEHCGARHACAVDSIRNVPVRVSLDVEDDRPPAPRRRSPSPPDSPPRHPRSESPPRAQRARRGSPPRHSDLLRDLADAPRGQPRDGSPPHRLGHRPHGREEAGSPPSGRESPPRDSSVDRLIGEYGRGRSSEPRSDDCWADKADAWKRPWTSAGGATWDASAPAAAWDAWQAGEDPWAAKPDQVGSPKAEAPGSAAPSPASWAAPQSPDRSAAEAPAAAAPAPSSWPAAQPRPLAGGGPSSPPSWPATQSPRRPGGLADAPPPSSWPAQPQPQDRAAPPLAPAAGAPQPPPSAWPVTQSPRRDFLRSAAPPQPSWQPQPALRAGAPPEACKDPPAPCHQPPPAHGVHPAAPPLDPAQPPAPQPVQYVQPAPQQGVVYRQPPANQYATVYQAPGVVAQGGAQPVQYVQAQQPQVVMVVPSKQVAQPQVVQQVQPQQLQPQPHQLPKYVPEATRPPAPCGHSPAWGPPPPHAASTAPPQPGDWSVSADPTPTGLPYVMKGGTLYSVEDQPRGAAESGPYMYTAGGTTFFADPGRVAPRPQYCDAAQQQHIPRQKDTLFDRSAFGTAGRF
eukprot:TRINITY_DN5804_c0_g1_i1.p1 TRINITY_DN5804_c0_g1~~TRINITY_DN5804_c0_g1_i1.p1  ORF type:complete len:747 (+),score=218.35 TRINITY_DN5804_c0_g1_i1:175-2415(+)